MKQEIQIQRKILELPRELFNEAAKPPYAHLFAMTDLGKMLFKALEQAGCHPQFHISSEENPIPFSGISINVAIIDEARKP